MRKLNIKTKPRRCWNHRQGASQKGEPMTHQIIPSTDCSDYKRPTRMQTIAGCVGFAALAFVPSIVDAALDMVRIPDAAVLALVAMLSVALVIAAAKL